MITLDASVVVAALLPGAASGHVERAAVAYWTAVADGSESVVQPVHWLAEVAGVMARLSPGTAEEDAVLLHALEWPVADAMDVWSRAVRMSIDLDHHLFDTLYHATAMEAGGVLVTADRRYVRKAEHIGHIRLVG